jgi:hypothetical protein
VRVSFLRVGASAFDVEVVAYVETRKGAEFLAIQEMLLLRIMECIDSAGVKLATSSQTIVVDAGGRALTREAAPDKKSG